MSWHRLFHRPSPPVKAQTITCPRCGMTSHHPEDIRHGYCGNCHDWTSPPADEEVIRRVLEEDR